MVELLHQLLEISSQKYGDKVAVIEGEKRITYEALNNISNQLAHSLKISGVVRGDRIGIYLNKSIETVIAIFGILKAGGIYVPLDPAAPVKRIALLINDCGMKAIISNKKKFKPLQENLDASLPLKTVILTDFEIYLSDSVSTKYLGWQQVLQADLTPLLSDLTCEDIAYILYTSGSTGNPKGVMISHAASLNFITWADKCFQIHEHDRISNHAPCHFDLSIFDIFTTIKAGATIVLVTRQLSVFPLNLARFIAQQDITIWYSVPSILIQLVLHGNLNQEQFPHLRHILFAGEVFPRKYLRELQTLLPHVNYHNLYGPTETNVCTYYPVIEMLGEQEQSLPIGKACANNDVFVVNQSGAIAQIDEIGELYVAGPSLMRGYWEMPEVTKTVLVADPRYSDSNVPKVYRTGDLVKLKADGNYQFLGRQDNLIKSRGYRIDLGEIESVIHKHPAVQEGVVIPIPDQQLGNMIKAIVVLLAEEMTNERELEFFCSQYLPKYMIPQFEFRDVLPKTSTGKIDRSLLRLSANNS